MITTGMSAEAALKVQFGDTAAALCLSPEDSFPPVFATSRMIALMEIAAARLMKPLLQEGQLSVGVGVDVSHTAATPIGHTVRAIATFLGHEGKLLRFKLQAFDAAGPIGEGEHTRAIVATERLMVGAMRRSQEVRS